uniref:SPATA1_C domain-containing protein n=1 Tax=Macrostomum lignano TaxID=282301 RepID=A0A1I8FQT3_9PLAT
MRPIRMVPNLLIEEATSIDPQEEMRRDREQLLSELQRIRDDRTEIERRRDDLIRRARQLQATKNMRNQARDNVEEALLRREEADHAGPRTRTRPTRLRDELESYHKRMVSTMTSESRKARILTHRMATQQLNLRISHRSGCSSESNRGASASSPTIQDEAYARSETAFTSGG